MGRKRKPSDVLRAGMEAKGWDPLRLAKESGVDVSLIRRYLDEDADIGKKNAPKLARPLDVDVLELLYGEAAA